MKNNRPSAQFKGTYRVQVFSKFGVLLKDTGEFDNLITDGFFNYGDPIVANNYLCIGAGVVTAPAFTDTQLGNQVGSVSIEGFLYPKVIGSPTTYPHVLKTSKEGVFSGIGGDLSEVGLRYGGPTGTLMSRSLIKDENGDPTSITVTPDLEVRVTYSVYSIIPDPVVSTGTLVTPYGTSDFTVYAPRYDAYDGNIYGVAALQLSKPMSGSSYYAGFAMANNDTNVNVSDNYSNSSSSYTLDLPNKKCTAHPYFPSKTTDYTFNKILSNGHSQWAYASPWIELDTPITVPAYYNAAFDIEFTWDRYDSGA